MTRVQPRVLTLESVGAMASKLESWCQSVTETLKTVEAHTSDELLD